MWDAGWVGYDAAGPDDQPFLAPVPRQEVAAFRNGIANMLDGSQNAAANLLAGAAGDDLYLVGNGDLVVDQNDIYDYQQFVNGGGGSSVYDFNLDGLTNSEDEQVILANLDTNCRKGKR